MQIGISQSVSYCATWLFANVSVLFCSWSHDDGTTASISQTLLNMKEEILHAVKMWLFLWRKASVHVLSR